MQVTCRKKASMERILTVKAGVGPNPSHTEEFHSEKLGSGQNGRVLPTKPRGPEISQLG